MRKKHKQSISLLKKALEKLQKELVIKKYGTDCYTCNAKNLEGKNCHLGHVPWPRSILSTECKYSIEYTRIQCMVCNIHRGGMGAEAIERMRREGIDTDQLKRRNEDTKGKQYDSLWYLNKIEEYKKL